MSEAGLFGAVAGRQGGQVDVGRFAAVEGPGSLEAECVAASVRLVGGVDEVGRGAWAGPIVAAAVCWDLHRPFPAGVTDSKRLSDVRRRGLIGEIMAGAASVTVAVRQAFEIDEVGIQAANLAVLREAVMALRPVPELVAVDHFRLPVGLPAVALTRGDVRSFTVGAASIVAKVVRDDLMKAAGETLPGYGFGSNVGYGTAEHRTGLDRLGVSRLHRRSFRPVAEHAQGRLL